MEKEFIPYEQALELKELGFDEPCFMFYEQEASSKYLQKGINDAYWGDYSEPQKWNSMPNKPWKPFCQCVSAPTFSQAFRWFREKYNLKEQYGVFPHHTIMLNYVIEGGKEEEAELACLIKLIEIVKKNK